MNSSSRLEKYLPAFLFWILVGFLAVSILVPAQDLLEGTVKIRRPLESIRHLGFAALAFLAALALLVKPDFPSRGLGYRTAWLFGFWILGAAFSATPRVALVAIAGFITRGWMPALAACRLGKNFGQTRRLSGALITITTACALVGLLEWYRGEGALFGPRQGLGYRLYSTIGHPLPLSCLLLMVFPLTLLIRNNAWRIVSFISMMACLVGTVSRSSWAIAFISFAAIFIALPRERSWLVRLAGASAVFTALLIGISFFHNPSSVMQWKTISAARLSQVVFRKDVLQSHRSGSYQTTWQMVKERPFLGGGMATYPYRYPLFLNATSLVSVPSPDNLYLRLLADTGLCGFGAFAILFIYLFRQAYSRLRGSDVVDQPFHLLILIGLCSVLLSSLFFDSLFWPSVLVPFSILLGFSQSSRHENT